MLITPEYGATDEQAAIYSALVEAMKKELAQLIADHTGQTAEQIERDSDRDRWFTAAEAKEYGFVDHVFERSQDATKDATGDAAAFSESSDH